MKSRAYLPVLLIISVFFQISCSRGPVTKKNSFDYLGQKVPGDTAALFAPGIISDTAKKARALAISPNGDELFFATGVWPNSRIMYMKKTGDKWSLPDTAIFSKECWATEPAFSPDGQYLYFTSSKGRPDIKSYSLWRVKKSGDNWSQPYNIFDIGGDSIWEFHPTITKGGTLFFCYWDSKNSTGDIYMSECGTDKCSDPVRIGAPVSSGYNDADPFVSQDGSFMIFSSNRPGGYGELDQYITYRNPDGTWSTLKNLGPKYNTRGDDYDIDITPDNKYLLIYMKSSIYWMPVGNLISRKE
jgi:hypothetical protein